MQYCATGEILAKSCKHAHLRTIVSDMRASQHRRAHTRANIGRLCTEDVREPHFGKLDPNLAVPTPTNNHSNLLTWAVCVVELKLGVESGIGARTHMHEQARL